jgi:uncharacterized membrane protein HdeD (DUF308 family)
MAHAQTHPNFSPRGTGLPLLRTLAENWWLLLLRGIAAIAFGVLAFIWPGKALLTLVLLWGIYALADGVLSLGAALFGGRSEVASRWWLGLIGIVGIVAGVFTFAFPAAATGALLFVIAIWAIITGVLEIVGALQLRKEVEGEWWLILSGALSVAFGVLLFARPGVGILALVWWIAGFAIVFGITNIALAFRVKQFK